MNKQEASSLLKELLAECKLDSSSFILMEPNPKDTFSSGYKITIKTTVDKECRQQLREITKKYDLAVIEEDVQITVYKPKPKHAGNLILE
jgi:hypothetical protein